MTGIEIAVPDPSAPDERPEGGAAAGGARVPGRRRSAVRLSDVAAAAGVSQKTVSNVINDYPFVAERTRARVTDAIQRLGYRPNLSARNLARGRTGAIALVIPELSNPYFSQLAEITLEEADRLSLAVLIEQTRGTREREEWAISGQRARMVDGIIMSVSALSAEDLRARTGTVPLVVLGERVFNGPVDHVAGDNVGAARDLTEHLLDTGRRQIALIGMESALEPGLVTLRRAGYTQALQRAGISVREELMVEVPSLTRECGAAAVEQLLGRTSFDAVLCLNDLLAVGALKALADHGIDVPGEVAVAGFDNIREGAYLTPALTTVDWDQETIVRQAVDLLGRRISARDGAEAADLVVQHQVVLRASTAAAT